MTDFRAAFRSAKDELWQEGALCAQVDMDIFFPDKGGSTREAKTVCMACDVREECLDYAVRTQEKFGIWGGLSAFERLKARQSAPEIEDSAVAA